MKFLKQLLNPQLLKYLVVGVTGTLLDIGALYFFYDVLGFNLYLSVTLSFTLALLNNFFLNKFWTFQSKSKNYRKLLTKFTIVSVIGLLLSLFSMYILTDLLGVWYLLSKIITSAIVVVWNFLANKFWTFRITPPIDMSWNPSLDLTILVPAYNEEKRLPKSLHQISKYMSTQQADKTYQILVVDDGSSDNTAQVVTDFQKNNPQINLISYPKNHGKGYAFKQGVLAAKGKWLLLTDADLSTPISDLEKLQNHITDQHQIIIGSRYMKNSNVTKSQPKYRIVLSRLANAIIQFLLISDIQDTQCGFKLFRTKYARSICHLQKIDRFGFDMEVLLIADNMGYQIKEVAVNWYNSEDSRVRPIRDACRTLKELFFIKLNLIAGRYNDF